MKKRILTGILILTTAFGVISVSGCKTKAQSGALIGTAAGVGLGQLIGGNTTGTLIGAGAGAVGGYIIGNEMDKSQQRKESEAAARSNYTPQSAGSAASTETVWVTNSNGSQTSVVLTRDNAGYIGPRGERYPTKPTEDQLRTAYGF